MGSEMCIRDRTLNGEAVARYIVSEDDRLDEQDDLYFYVREPFATDSIYLAGYQYQLRIDRSRVVDASIFDGVDLEAEYSREGLLSLELTTDKLYSASLANQNPWYDTRLLAVGANARSVNFSVDFASEINPQAPAYLQMELAGGIDIPVSDEDHHVQVFILSLIHI